MTNTEIIWGEVMDRELITKEQIDKLKRGEEVELDFHTYQVWKQLGYQVKRGEKALFKTRLWKFTDKRKNEETQENEDDRHYYLAPAAIFGRHQVEAIEA